MAMLDRIRRLGAMRFVVAVGACLHAGLDARLAMAQARIMTGPGTFPQFGPNHQSEQPGFGIPTSPIFPNVGIDPVFAGAAHPHSRTPTAYFPMVKDSRLTFGAALAADRAAFAGVGGYGLGGYGLGGYGLGGYGLGGYGLGGYGAGGYGAGGYGLGGYGLGGYGLGGFGAGSFGNTGLGVGTSLPPLRESGPGTYRAGNAFANSTVSMGMGGGNPAVPAAGNAGPNSVGVASEDAFDNAANGRPSATRSVRSNRATSARRPTARKSTPQPSRKVETRATDPAPSRPGTASPRPRQADRAVEKSNTAKSEETKSPPRRSMLGSPR